MRTISDHDPGRDRQTVQEPETAEAIRERIAHVIDLLAMIEAVAERHTEEADKRVEAVVRRVRRLTEDQREVCLAGHRPAASAGTLAATGDQARTSGC